MATRTPDSGSNEARGLERHPNPSDPGGPLLRHRPDMSLKAQAARKSRSRPPKPPATATTRKRRTKKR